MSVAVTGLVPFKVTLPLAVTIVTLPPSTVTDICNVVTTGTGTLPAMT